MHINKCPWGERVVCAYRHVLLFILCPEKQGERDYGDEINYVLIQNTVASLSSVSRAAKTMTVIDYTTITSSVYNRTSSLFH